MSKNSRFFDTYIGEYVSILLRSSINIPDTDNQLTPISLHGLFIDMDDKYVYLGEQKEVITNSVKEEDIIHIRIIHPQENDQLMQILEDFDPPNENIN